MAIIYRKTEKGLTEVETRAHRLPPRLRTALIIVDGRRTDIELQTLIPQQAAEVLASLLEGGFIEEAGLPQPPMAAVPAPAAQTFEAIRRDAVAHLTELLGPVGEALAQRMERCRDASELRPLLGTAFQIIASTRNRPLAQEYIGRFSDL